MSRVGRGVEQPVPSRGCDAMPPKLASMTSRRTGPPIAALVYYSGAETLLPWGAVNGTVGFSPCP